VTTHVETSDTALAKRVIIGLSIFVSLAVAVLLAVAPRGDAGEGPSLLVTANACLNATAATLLTAGWLTIRARNRVLHRAFMLGAFALSSLFLVLYLIHHAQVGSLPYQGEGWLRVVYFSLLIPHIILAAVIVPMALFTIYRAWTGRFALHRKVARWTLPLWLFVSVSGVAIYWMQYHL
jgi:putative membrane protein